MDIDNSRFNHPNELLLLNHFRNDPPSNGSRSASMEFLCDGVARFLTSITVNLGSKSS